MTKKVNTRDVNKLNQNKHTQKKLYILRFSLSLYISVFFVGVTILLSLTVFLNLVAETLPQVSDAIPLLGSNKCQKQNKEHTHIKCIQIDFEKKRSSIEAPNYI